MAYNIFLMSYLFACNVSVLSATIYACNRTADCGCSKYDANVYKIVGGENSYPLSWNWAVSLQSEAGGHFCTGSIVSPLHIVTAAHCVTDEDTINSTYVVVGIDRLFEPDESLAQVRSISKVFMHPDYNIRTNINDIAVLQLDQPFVISNELATARLCLPRTESPTKATGYPADSTTLVAIGWGHLVSEAPSIPVDLHLQQVTLKAVPVADDTCKQFINDSRSQFCAGVKGGGKDTCQGDSGGPLMRFEPTQKRWVLAGVTSSGLGCGDPRYSGVYTRVSVYRDWLRTVISDGFIESSVDLDSVAPKNYYNMYIVLLSIVQFYIVFSWNK